MTHALRTVWLLMILGVMLAARPALAQDLSVKAAVLIAQPEPPLPISRLDLPVGDEGFMGARVATADNATTGQFLGHKYETLEVTVAPEEAIAALDDLIAQDVHFVVVAAPAEVVLALADHAADQDVLLFNASAEENILRTDECRANLFHTAPSRAQVADGLAQYLIWKKWDEWLLVHGSHPADLAMAEAYRRAAAKFRAEIVEERLFEDTGGARRSDSGHVLVQKQIPVFMQEADDHHVVVAADQSEVFGVYLPYRGWDPRPVAGDAGLIASTWHPAHESYGSTQLQRRFEKAAGRHMTDLDYQVWLALRSVSEAVTRTSKADPATVRDYLRSDAFEMAGFKGIALSFRPWNQQFRHGIILGDGKLVVSISPQDEFLHQRTRLDTLGFDEPESKCRL